MPSRIFISYKRDVSPDDGLARQLWKELKGDYKVFLDREGIEPGQRWSGRIEDELARADFFIALVSAHSVGSDMVRDEVTRAYRRERSSRRPVILWIRVAYSDDLPAPLSAYLNPIQGLRWRNQGDTQRLLKELRGVLEGGWPAREVSEAGSTEDSGVATSTPGEPAPAAGPIFIQERWTPGQVNQADKIVIMSTGPAAAPDSDPE